MDIRQHWPAILRVLHASKRSTRHFSIATVTPDGQPHVTPIGHAFFREDMTGYYFDAYSQAMPPNLAHIFRRLLAAKATATLRLQVYAAPPNEG